MTNTEQTLREALEATGCERLKEWAAIGPVQRAALEQFVCALASLPAQEQPAEPLSDDTIKTMWDEVWATNGTQGSQVVHFARAIEAALASTPKPVADALRTAGAAGPLGDPDVIAANGVRGTYKDVTGEPQ